MPLIDSLLSTSRLFKRVFSMVVDIIFILIAFWGAFATRELDFLPFIEDLAYWQLAALLVVTTLLIFIKVGLYRAVLRYLSLHALLTITISIASSAAIMVLIAYFTNIYLPRSVPIIYATYLVLLCGGARLIVRLLISHIQIRQKPRVIIYGAGSAGRQLSKLLAEGDEYHPIAFVDDNKKLHKSVMQGLTIYDPAQLDSLISRTNASKILLAMPSATRGQRTRIVNNLVQYHLEVLTIPNFEDLVNGKLSLDQLQDVPIEDLLGRDPVTPRDDLMQKNITGKVVMVTGAGGSIGSELCRQILNQKPTKLVLFELSEFGLYQIEKELSEYVNSAGLQVEVIPLLGSVQRINRLAAVMKSFKVQTLYHAAAYKHVPLVEFNVVEGVQNNIFGTYFTAKAAIEAEVESFVLISTDKAVRPTNVMGATKRMAELALQALAKQDTGTRFCMVRFGNVLGSSGSVIPLFKRQILAGGPITVTHPDIIRYFMTIPEAAQLVIQAGAMGKGGDVFVLDMGEPVKIVDLAKNLINLTGLEVKSIDNPHGDIEISYTGLRPGEKLFEELLIGDNVAKTEHERIMTANEISLTFDEFKAYLDQLDSACHKFDHATIRQLLLDAPTGFAPSDGICDLVWQANWRQEGNKSSVDFVTAVQ